MKTMKRNDECLGGSGQRRPAPGSADSRVKTDVAQDTATVRAKHDRSPYNAGKTRRA